MSLERNRGNNNCIPFSGIGYVVIPDGSDAAEYVQRCYRNQTISINGGFGSSSMHNVKIVEGVLDRIKFPSNGSSQGSAVVWVRESFYNRPVVVGVVPEGGKSNLSNAGQARLLQEVLQRAAEVFVDGANSRVNISALGDDTKCAEINIKASSRVGEDDVVNVESNDLVKISGKRYRLNFTKDIELLINNGKEDLLKVVANEEKVEVIDHWGNNIVADAEKVFVTDANKNQVISNADEVHVTDAHENEIILNQDNVQILCKKFNVGEGKEQMILGNTLVDLLTQLIDAIISLTVITPQGASGTPINAATFAQIKSQLETALSKLSNTD